MEAFRKTVNSKCDKGQKNDSVEGAAYCLKMISVEKPSLNKTDSHKPKGNCVTEDH